MASGEPQPAQSPDERSNTDLGHLEGCTIVHVAEELRLERCVPGCPHGQWVLERPDD